MRVRSVGLERAWQPAPVLPGEPHGLRSLAGSSPYNCKELDMTEATEHSRCTSSMCRAAGALEATAWSQCGPPCSRPNWQGRRVRTLSVFSLRTILKALQES